MASLCQFLKSHKNAQNSYLAGMIAVIPVKRRRPRQTEENAILNDFSHDYKICVAKDDTVEEIKVCFKAFLEDAQKFITKLPVQNYANEKEQCHELAEDQKSDY
ncbi:hypothetical protein ANN_21488 [Periplaneta americana]|uniref:Uncharacterized protein n=1 Tax=Periplaneta americana TaxID=6978 RepID=A0ABQ8SFE8_PERAM|nr:hypothetical protein ANN_21488 [Periplaneta americana]